MTSASASRVTRSKRSLQLALLLFAGVLAGVTALRAQDAAPPAPVAKGESSAQPAGTPAPPAAAADKNDAAATGDAAKQPGPAAPGGSTPSRFEPTEKVRADFDVSFPIDI